MIAFCVFEELREEHGGEEGLLSNAMDDKGRISKGNLLKALKEIAPLSGGESRAVKFSPPSVPRKRGKFIRFPQLAGGTRGGDRFSLRELHSPVSQRGTGGEVNNVEEYDLLRRYKTLLDEEAGLKQRSKMPWLRWKP